jgi:hypothetical protein
MRTSPSLMSFSFINLPCSAFRCSFSCFNC